MKAFNVKEHNYNFKQLPPKGFETWEYTYYSNQVFKQKPQGYEIEICLPSVELEL